MKSNSQEFKALLDHYVSKVRHLRVDTRAILFDVRLLAHVHGLQKVEVRWLLVDVQLLRICFDLVWVLLQHPTTSAHMELVVEFLLHVGVDWLAESIYVVFLLFLVHCRKCFEIGFAHFYYIWQHEGTDFFGLFVIRDEVFLEINSWWAFVAIVKGTGVLCVFSVIAAHRRFRYWFFKCFCILLFLIVLDQDCLTHLWKFNRGWLHVEGTRWIDVALCSLLTCKRFWYIFSLVYRWRDPSWSWLLIVLVNKLDVALIWVLTHERVWKLIFNCLVPRNIAILLLENPCAFDLGVAHSCLKHCLLGFKIHVFLEERQIAYLNLWSSYTGNRTTPIMIVEIVYGISAELWLLEWLESQSWAFAQIARTHSITCSHILFKSRMRLDECIVTRGKRVSFSFDVKILKLLIDRVYWLFSGLFSLESWSSLNFIYEYFGALFIISESGLALMSRLLFHNFQICIWLVD